LDLIHALFLALVQGITEFLPISSSAHLVLPSELLGWPDQGLAFDVAVHFGSLIAVIAYFRQDLVKLLGAGTRQLILQQPSDDGRYAVNLLIACLPILPVGYFGRFFIEENFRSIEIIAASTILFALALWYADRIKQVENNELTPGRALSIGVAQCLALIPGTSRSGVTMTAALLMGYSRTQAARISFLIAIPTIIGGALLKLIDLVTEPGSPDWLVIGVGTVLSGISAYAAIALLLNFVERIGYLPFVIYRLVLGAVLILILVS